MRSPVDELSIIVEWPAETNSGDGYGTVYSLDKPIAGLTACLHLLCYEMTVPQNQ